MTTIIIDDEQPAINILSGFIEKVPYLNLQLATTNAFEALEHLNNQNIDLMFLDIEMPDISGVELLKSLNNKPKVIFTTAYEKYALQGYELDIIDYLVKPIRFERFLKAANKAYNLHQLTTPQFDDYLLLKVDYKNIKVKLTDIEYIEGLKDYVKVYTTQGMLVPRLNLKAIAAKLPANEFIRIHRSYIVAHSKVTSFQKGQIFLGKKAIPVGITYQEKLIGMFS